MPFTERVTLFLRSKFERNNSKLYFGHMPKLYCSMGTGSVDHELRKMFEQNLVSLEYAAAAKSLQSCPTLCDPIDGSPPGSPVPGILHEELAHWKRL